VCVCVCVCVQNLAGNVHSVFLLLSVAWKNDCSIYLIYLSELAVSVQNMPFSRQVLYHGVDCRVKLGFYAI
jgi:hypothetical protein